MIINLKDVSGTYKPDDLIPITIEQIKNPNTDTPNQNKYIIHADKDSFGLFSEKYSYCSSKYIVQELTKINPNYQLKHFRYSNGYITLYIKTPDDMIFNLKENVKNLVIFLSSSDMRFIKSSASYGVYVINSYNGSSRLVLGHYIEIKFDELSLFVKLDVQNDKNVHINGISDKINDFLKSAKFSIDDLHEKIDFFLLDEIIKKHISKKLYEEMILSFNELKITKYTALEALVFLAYKDIGTSKEIAILKEITSLTNPKKEV